MSLISGLAMSLVRLQAGAQPGVSDTGCPDEGVPIHPSIHPFLHPFIHPPATNKSPRSFCIASLHLGARVPSRCRLAGRNIRSLSHRWSWRMRVPSLRQAARALRGMASVNESCRLEDPGKGPNMSVVLSRRPPDLIQYRTVRKHSPPALFKEGLVEGFG